MRRWIEDVMGDVRFATRQLRAAPAFTAVAALTLAFGIGANSAIFALVDATLLRPLPFGDPGRLVAIWETTGRSDRGAASPLNMIDWEARSRSFERVAGFVANVGSMVMSGRSGLAETVPRQWVTAGLFDVLGARPLIGGTFHAADGDKPANLVVFSEGFWRSHFNADPAIVGRDVRFDGELFTVRGVMPADFQLLGSTSMWAMRWIPNRPQLRGAYALNAVARLKPGVTIEAAQSDLDTVAAELAREFPATNTGRGVRLEPLHDSFVGRDLRLTSMLFVGVVGFVLMICCANVANLLLVRATARTRELAIRTAVGAQRGRIVRQLLTESVVLSMIGGVLAIAIGAGLLRVAPSLVPAGILPAAVTLTFDWRVVFFCLAAAMTVGVLFGLVPAWHATGPDTAQSMATGTRTSTGRGSRVRGWLVIGEVAIAVLLLFGAGLLLRTLLTVAGVDRGYGARGVVTMMVDPLSSQYPTPPDLMRFFESVEREILDSPDARSVGWTSTVPLGASTFGPVGVAIVGDPLPPSNQRPLADFQIASPGYFRTVDLPIVRGRSFTEADTPASTRTGIVSEAFVRRYVGTRSPIGLRIALRPADAPEAAPSVLEIVGVARQVKARPDEIEEAARVYVPLAQSPVDDIYLVVAPEAGRENSLVASVRAAIGRVDRAQLVSVPEAMTLEAVAWQATGRYRFRAVLVGTFAALALLLAMVGVFGVLGYAVQQRWREFGIRRALGATTRDVMMLVAGGASRLVLTGAVLGLVAAVLSARAISTFLFGVRPFDPMTFGLVAFVLVMTAAMAAIAPAIRAARVDPAVAFRIE